MVSDINAIAPLWISNQARHGDLFPNTAANRRAL